jgi:hypothetical protein
VRASIAIPLLFSLAACADSTSGPPPGTRGVVLASVADGISGSALLADEGAAVTTVWVTLQGLAPGVAYSGSVGRGSCQSPGESVATLVAMTTTTTAGSAVTPNVPDSVLQAGFHIRYAKPGVPPPMVACGNID